MTQDEPPHLERRNSSRQSSTFRKFLSAFSRLLASPSGVQVPPGGPPTAHERFLANIRVFCVVAVLAAVSLVSPRPAPKVYGVLSAWAMYSVGLLIAVRRGASFPRRRGILIHIVDVAAAAMVIFLVDGTGIPLLVTLGFVMFAAGYRWGVRETLWTGIASALLFSGNAVLTLASDKAGGTNSGFTVHTFFVQLGYLLFVTATVAYFAYQHRISRTELAAAAAQAERFRLARELHDGTIQSLLAIKLRVDALRLSGSLGPTMLEELGEYESLLAREIVNLRMLTFELAPSEERPAALTTELRDLVDRFEHASGLTARFVPSGNVDRPSPYAHHEIVRIVQESLLNVHRHSGARQVLVRLAQKADHWELSVEDDGRGFDFEGRATQEELDRIGKGPRIIKQRVRLLNGSLTIESTPGTGAKLTISLPLNI